MHRNGRAHELGLLAIVAFAVTLAGAFTWWDIEQDRSATRAASTRLTDSLAESIESHVDAALRDARNAALSAALLVENAGGTRAFHSQQMLHAELKRELWDEQSTARLLIADTDGWVLASSAEFPVPRMRLPPESTGTWPSRRTTGRLFRLGSPQRSTIDGQFVLPYSCEIVDAAGRVTGTLRAELRLEYFLKLYRSVTSLNRGAVVLMSVDGVTLMRAPMEPQFLGRRGAGVQAFLDLATGDSGNLEFRPARDGIPRYYSWRRMKDEPLILAVGLDKDAVMAPWAQRAVHRVTLAVAACAAIVVMSWLMVLYTRRLAGSQSRLRQAENRYWTAMENSTVGVVITSMDGRWKHANPAMCAILGYSLQELEALPLGKLTIPELRAPLAAKLAALRSGRIETLEHESCVMHKDGRRIWVNVHASLLRDADGAPEEVLVHAKDITERKLAEQAIRQLNDDLERRVAERTAQLSRANEDLEAFSYSVAHDLRGPIGCLAGFVGLLAKDLGVLPAAGQRRIDSIKRQTRQMSALVEDLLALSHTSRSELRQVPVDMNALVADVCENLDAQVDGRDVQWKVAVLPEVRADRGLLRQALTNLLGNALKYTRGRETAIIEVGSAPSDSRSEAVFFVRDNGAGFDMQYAADLFMPFKRLHSSAQFEGTGVGLAIVRRIIERNGGRIWAESTPGKGATFNFSLQTATQH